MDRPKISYEKVAEDEREKALPMLARYGGAWAEYNARITARQTLTQMWLTALPLLVGTAYAATLPHLKIMAAFAVPIVNALHAGLMWMHDAMMAKLHIYMIRCELWKNEDSYMPSYHVDADRYFLHVRRWQNYSFVVIAVVFSIIAFIAFFQAILKESSPDFWTPFQILFVLGAVISPYFYLRAINGRQGALEDQKTQAHIEKMRCEIFNLQK